MFIIIFMVLTFNTCTERVFTLPRREDALPPSKQASGSEPAICRWLLPAQPPRCNKRFVLHGRAKLHCRYGPGSHRFNTAVFTVRDVWCHIEDCVNVADHVNMSQC